MFRHEIENRIVEALQRFKSLDYQGLIHEVLNRGSNWSEPNEQLLNGSLRKLAAEGRITSVEGVYGPHTLPASGTQKT